MHGTNPLLQPYAHDYMLLVRGTTSTKPVLNDISFLLVHYIELDSMDTPFLQESRQNNVKYSFALCE